MNNNHSSGSEYEGFMYISILLLIGIFVIIFADKPKLCKGLDGTVYEENDYEINYQDK